MLPNCDEPHHWSLNFHFFNFQWRIFRDRLLDAIADSFISQEGWRSGWRVGHITQTSVDRNPCFAKLFWPTRLALATPFVQLVLHRVQQQAPKRFKSRELQHGKSLCSIGQFQGIFEQCDEMSLSSKNLVLESEHKIAKHVVKHCQSHRNKFSAQWFQRSVWCPVRSRLSAHLLSILWIFSLGGGDWQPDWFQIRKAGSSNLSALKCLVQSNG